MASLTRLSILLCYVSRPSKALFFYSYVLLAYYNDSLGRSLHFALCHVCYELLVSASIKSVRATLAVATSFSN
jgi:hypothetical protein